MMLAYIQTFTYPDYFQTWLMIETAKQHYDTSFDDLDLHSRSQLCEKSKPVVPISSKNFQMI